MSGSGRFSICFCDLLPALSLEYNILVYLLEQRTTLEKDIISVTKEFERVLRVSQGAEKVFNNVLQKQDTHFNL